MKLLKVGDRVAVYGKSGNFCPIRGVGVIEAILSGDIVRLHKNDSLYQKYDSGHGGFDLTLVHRKQCRLLKQKRKPREIWVNEYDNVLGVQTFLVEKDAEKITSRTAAVRFREVERKVVGRK